ncbi:MAG: 3-phosphoshikimate 1-carboxyvinyltransferase [Spirochaetae bacterium HGW-Spirochaetae-9]|nr:MAG: 3-phosphoshikimate 1-carboxyvinyltransferase [Spirochaetae bacterium HGW-Spirochaetae-9]
MTMHCCRGTVSGSIDAPASKSSMQRAVACATLAQGKSRLLGGELCADSESALRLSKDLGATVHVSGPSIEIEGSPLFAPAALRSADPSDSVGFSEPVILDCGESGLCMRMFSPVAALLERKTRMTGRGSLLRRPMGMVEKPLHAFGASCASSEGFAPLSIKGPLRGGKMNIDAGESSQLLTGLLIALPLCLEDSELRVENAVSKGYLDVTIDTCAAFGVTVERDVGFSRFSIRGRQEYCPASFQVEGDWSGAAFLVASAAIAAGEGGLEIRSLNADSSQPDKAIMQAALSAGAPLRFEGDSLFVARAHLHAFEFDATDCPDLFPPLVALASACRGVSTIRGIHRLRGKESDRAASLKAAFEALGVTVSFEGDAMLVRGGELRGGEVDACGDHRIAMAAATASFAARSCVVIRGSECVSKSWPRFFEDIASIRH